MQPAGDLVPCLGLEAHNLVSAETPSAPARREKQITADECTHTHACTSNE